MFVLDLYGLETHLQALPYCLTSILFPLSSYLSAFLIRNEYLSVTHVRKLFNCGAFIFQTFAAVAAACWMTPEGSITCISLIIGIGAFSWTTFE